jgi:RNA polymerase sigma factor (sigma-70 family)
MTLATNDFAALLQRVRTGCPDAKKELFERYGEAVRRVVRRWLQQPMRRQYDSVDFEQSVWASFFLGATDRYSFPTADDLVAFLSRVAYNKVMDATRERLNQKHDLRRECSLDEPTSPGSPDPLVNNLPGPTHTPSHYVVADERWRKLTKNLPPGHVRILELLQAGYTQAEIAQRLGCDPKTIRRLLDKLSEIVFPS